MPKFKKLISGFFVVLVIFLAIILAGHLLFNLFYPFPKKVTFGVSFSPKFATDLRLEWKQTYINILDDLKVKNLRIPTYWDTIEKNEGFYDFQDVDFMLDEGAKRNARIILTLGERQYRWPECHVPEYVKALSPKDRKQKTLDFIKAIVERYKSHPSLYTWQVENEALLTGFGYGCSEADRVFLKTEVNLVRSLDSKPVILTDSGELRPWVTPMRFSDIFGTTLYRTVYNQFLGHTSYPALPFFYNIKSSLVRSIFAPQNQKTIIIELQAEPWSLNNNLADTDINQQAELFTINNFKDNTSFAKGTGFDEVYFWGVEWWYFMDKAGNSSYLDYARGFWL